MAYEMKDMSFNIFKVNKTKEGQPDYRMELMFKGEKLRIAMWRKTTNSGEPFWSGNIEVGERQQQSDTPFQKKETPKQNDLDDDIPF